MAIELVDTHCHIQFPDYKIDPDEAIASAQADGVTRLLVVGTDLEASKKAIDFVQSRDNCWATIGLHPHEGAVYVHDEQALAEFAALATQPKVVAIGETGLDYYYQHSPKEDQIKLLEFQLELAQKHDLPVVFHVRDAFTDFWPIVDRYPDLKGVIHSFSATKKELAEILKRDYYIGLNGIMTFSKNQAQLDAAKSIPIDHLVLETDAPFLTPAPFRGKICEPKHVRVTAEFLAQLRGENLSDLAEHTTQNARALFKI